MKISRSQRRRAKEAERQALNKARVRRDQRLEQDARLSWQSQVGLMELEEIYTLCRSDRELLPWQREFAERCWGSAAQARTRQALRAGEPWPEGRMFPPRDHVQVEEPRFSACWIARRDYEVISLLRREGVLHGPPEAWFRGLARTGRITTSSWTLFQDYEDGAFSRSQDALVEVFHVASGVLSPSGAPISAGLLDWDFAIDDWVEEGLARCGPFRVGLHVRKSQYHAWDGLRTEHTARLIVTDSGFHRTEVTLAELAVAFPEYSRRMPQDGS